VSNLRYLTQGFFGRKGADHDEIRRVQRDLDVDFPADFVSLLEGYDAAEGYVVGGYLQVWPVVAMVDLNRRARVEDNVPGLVVVATDAGGDGYGLDRTTSTFVWTPMIGMSTMKPVQIGKTFEQLLAWIADRYPIAEPPLDGPPATYGLVIHEKHPIVLGGSPTDPDNKVLIPLDKYVDVVAWWNERIRDGLGVPAQPAGDSRGH
jgi:hypothetical protein